MNGSFHSGLKQLVVNDAARLSGEGFAERRGAGVARRVRTRRTVRAAGIGGGTMLTAGALVLGAMNMPWGATSAPGPGGGVGGGCATPSPSGAGIMLITAGPRPLPTDTTWWTGYDKEGFGQFAFAPMDDGKWLVTYAAGGNKVVTPTEAGAVSFDLPDGVRVTLEVAVVDGRTEVSVVKPSSVAVVLGSAGSDDCYTPSPAPSNYVEPTPDPGLWSYPTLGAKPEDVVGNSPFQCGFEFPAESYATDTQSIDALEWISPDEINAQIKASHPGSGSDIYQAEGQGDVPVVTVNDNFGSSLGEWVVGGSDAVDPMQMLGERDPDARPSGVKTAHGSSFVAVTDGVVVGTIVEPFAPDTAPPVYQRILGKDFDESLALLNADNAFTACAGATLDGDWDLYAVAGDVARESDGTVHGPDYFWLKVGKR